MIDGKKAARAIPVNEKLETTFNALLERSKLSCTSANPSIKCGNTQEEQVSNNTTLTKSKKKRLRTKKGKLKQIETQINPANSDKLSKPNNILQTVSNIVQNNPVAVEGSVLSVNNSDSIVLQTSIKEINQSLYSIKNTEQVKQSLFCQSGNPTGILNIMGDDKAKQEKSKEEILLERQAKKLAKQQAKKKDKPVKVESLDVVDKGIRNSETLKNIKLETSIIDKTVTVGNTIDHVDKKSDVSFINVNKDNMNKAQKCNIVKQPVKCDKKSDDVVSKVCDVVDGEISFRMKPPLLPSNVKEDVKSEKSREDIMAEREAKKLSKLAKKQISKELPGAAVKENIPVEIKIEDVKKTAPPTEEKSKADLRAERRAKQEAQRAAKDAQKKAATAPPPVVEKKLVRKSPEVKKTVIKVEDRSSEFKIHQHKLFSHLCTEPQPLDLTSKVHPAVIELGKKYATRVVSGSNARCVSLLLALKQVISDYKVSSMSDLNRGLEAELASIGSYLSRSRPLSVSMTNSLRYLRSHLTQTSQLPDEEAKRRLFESIDTFIREQVDVAGQAISNTVQEKISNGDVILTYGCSSLVWRCLKESYQAGKEFSVVVVDGGPWYEGRELLRRLADLSIPCTYLLISAVGFAITKISKVLLGAHALLANGYVMSRTGSAMIALTASAHSVPVLVCCETYKFCERVQADAFVYNELGGNDEVSLKAVKWLSPVYDITPPDLVTAVVTELAILPCTSVPVVLRVKPSDIHHTA